MYDWRHISACLGKLILAYARTNRTPTHSPYFSVIIASYERPQFLTKLFDLLQRQVFADFEVIVVDQSTTPYEHEALQCNFPIHYIHTTEKGAVKARNLGIKHARGQVLAFTDDDCQPHPQWLANAYKYFHHAPVVGVEGFIESDEHDEERYRIVRSLGVKGLGFKTANLLLRKDIIEKIGGFDERFDNPHFREDTDLAWRALTEGEIPFADDVRVLHPAVPRDIHRESRAERAKFFVHDPLLFHKHPERYVQLLKAEKHYAQTPGFWEHFMRGMLRYKVEIPIEDLRPFTTAEQYSLLGELSKLCCLEPFDAPRLVESFGSMDSQSTHLTGEDRLTHVGSAARRSDDWQ
jgi:GT2 family glycosyltransferase